MPEHLKSAPARSRWPRLSPSVLAVAGGMMLAALSVAVLDWAGGVGRSDLRAPYDFFASQGVDALAFYSEAYLRFWAMVGLVVGAGLAGAATLGASRLRPAAVPVAGLLALWHLITVIDIENDGLVKVQFGAWLGVIGYLTVASGLIIASGSSPPARTRDEYGTHLSSSRRGFAIPRSLRRRPRRSSPG
ncbi:MAG: hypothetical protein ACRD0V_20225 [Acidimicrobiales bacterium]